MKIQYLLVLLFAFTSCITLQEDPIEENEFSELERKLNVFSLELTGPSLVQIKSDKFSSIETTVWNEKNSKQKEVYDLGLDSNGFKLYDGGTYLFTLKSYWFEDLIELEDFEIVTEPIDDYEPNDSEEEATLLNFEKAYDFSFTQNVLDRDLFKFSIDQERKLSINIERIKASLGNSDNLIIYKDDLKNVIYKGELKSTVIELLKAGTYFVEFTNSKDGRIFDTGSKYRLNISIDKAEELTSGSSFETAKSIDFNTNLNVFISKNSSAFFSLEIENSCQDFSIVTGEFNQNGRVALFNKDNLNKAINLSFSDGAYTTNNIAIGKYFLIIDGSSFKEFEQFKLVLNTISTDPICDKTNKESTPLLRDTELQGSFWNSEDIDIYNFEINQGSSSSELIISIDNLIEDFNFEITNENEEVILTGALEPDSKQVVNIKDFAIGKYYVRLKIDYSFRTKFNKTGVYTIELK